MIDGTITETSETLEPVVGSNWKPNSLWMIRLSFCYKVKYRVSKLT